MIRSVILLIRNSLLDWYYWPRSRQEFTARFARVRPLADTVDLIFAYVGGGFYRNLKPNQDRSRSVRLPNGSARSRR